LLITMLTTLLRLPRERRSPYQTIASRGCHIPEDLTFIICAIFVLILCITISKMYYPRKPR